MFFQITTFLLDVAAGLLGGACLLRLYMQHQRVPFGNPVGRFVFALTNWIVLPLRKVLPGYKRWDFASLVAAYLFELAQFGILALMLGHGAAVVPVLALFGLIRLVISGAVGLTIVYAILSWVRADSPMTDVIDRLAAPLLRPFRRIIPLVGGFDLSPLALLVVLQVLAIIVANVQGAMLR
jgi:YggT family protein